jgi:tetratricopeptide (TPR) repeat protein
VSRDDDDGDEPPGQRQAARADALMEIERYAEAVALWAKVIASQPAEARPHARMAAALWHLDRNREALAAIERALGLRQTEYYHRQRALILMDLDDRHEAIRAARAAVRLGPGTAAAHVTLARALLEDRSLEPALESARRAVKLDPNEAWHWEIQGRIAQRLGDFALAVLSFRKALAQKPADGYYHMVLANCLYEAGRHAECLKTLRSSLRLDPTNVWVIAMIAYELATLGQTEEATAMRATAERTAGDDCTRWQKLGMAAVRVLNRADAITAYRRAVALDPKNSEAAHGLANWLSTCPETLAAVETAAAANPTNESLLCDRVDALVELGRAEEALAIARAHRQQTGAAAPLITTILSMKATELFPEIEPAIAAMPEDHEGLENRAIVALLRQDWPAAAQGFRRVLAIASNCCCSWAGLAMALARQGQPAEARTCLERSQRENEMCDCERVKQLRALLAAVPDSQPGEVSQPAPAPRARRAPARRKRK